MPDARWFVPFYEHNPSSSDQCIYFTLRGARCRAFCEVRDNRRAIELYRTIIRLPAEEVGIELIEDYILCVCCRFGNAQHRDRIEDAGLWTPLAVRWLDEIRGQSNRFVPATPTTTASSRYGTPTSSRINTTTPPTSVASSSAYRNAFPETPTRIAPLSKFRPHIPEPGPADSVSSKIRDILEDRDFETGSLYIFDRDSSPGFVNIGWTAGSVRHSLQSWSECGYTPNLLFSVDRVPHAQRAKTLTQYELINEWRRERKCRAEHCGKSHQGWFEVRRERAKEVLGDWAKFMEIAKPYGSGVLKAQWRNFIERTVNNGETVTAKKLLEHYELSLPGDTTPVERSIDLEDDLQNVPKLESEGPKKKSVHWDSLRMEQSTSTKETEASPEPNSLAGNSRPGPSSLAANSLPGPSSGGSLFGPNPLEGNSRPGPKSGIFLFGQSSLAGNSLPGPNSGDSLFGSSSLAGNSLPGPKSGNSLFGSSSLAGNSLPGPNSGNSLSGSSSLAGDSLPGPKSENSLFGPSSFAGNSLPGPKSGKFLFGQSSLAGNSLPGSNSGDSLFGSNSLAGNSLPGPNSGNSLFGSNSLAGNSLPGPKSGNFLFGQSSLAGNSLPGSNSGYSLFGSGSLAGNSLPGSNSGNSLFGSREQPKSDPIKFDPPPNSLFSFTAESSFNGTKISKIENPKTEALPGLQFSSVAEPSFKGKSIGNGSNLNGDSAGNDVSVLRDAAVFGNSSNSSGDSAGQTAAGTLPRTDFTSELESPWKTSVPSVSFGTEPLLKTKPLHKDVPAERATNPLPEDVPAERAPADEESSPEQTPQPPSPLFQPVDSQDTQLTEPDPGPEIEEPSLADVIIKPNTSSAATPSSESNPLNSSSATSPPEPEAKQTSDLPAPLVQEIPGGQEKATVPASFMQKACKMLRNMWGKKR